MQEFIKYEVWKDYWCFKPIAVINFTELEKLNFCCWSHIKNGELQIRIESTKADLEPSRQQIQTFKSILSKQEEILKSIFGYYNNVILPVYEAATDIEEEEIATNVSQLNKVFGIKSIEIPQFETSTSNYFIIQFDFRYDCEHGLNILFEDTRPIDFFGDGDKNYDAITIYQTGLINKNREPINFSIHYLNNETIFKGNHYFEEQIEFSLKEGTYRTFISYNDYQLCINFHVPNNLYKFTLEQIIKMK